ncbi:MAG: ABC-2 type transport system permease protein [Gammaproteobacteria bacterium]|jgi:ABC-2 type transport system permease protein
MIGVIARREAVALFRTPLAWALLAMTQFILAYQFLAQIEIYLQFEDKLRSMPEAPGVTEVVVIPTLGIGAMLMLFVIPVLTMSSVCAERRNGTLALLYSSPVRCTEIVIGKFFGICFLLSLVWVIVAVMPLTLMWGAPLDLGTYSCGLGALALLMVTYAAVGVMFSSLFTQPAVAAVMSFGLLGTLWLIDWATRLGQDGGLFTYLSSINHFQRLSGGFVDSADISYFVVLTLAALAIATWRLNGDLKPL